MRKFLLNTAFLVGLLSTSHVYAQSAVTEKATAGWTAIDTVSANLLKRYPSTTFKNIKESQVKGIYEVTMGKNIGYVEETGRYFFFGKLFDMQTQTDLTESPRNEANKVDFDKLPLGDAIKFKVGNGKRVFAVFSDPDCPYCKQLENTLSRMTDYTMYVFMFPIESLHPDAPKRAESIWCAKDRGTAWKDWLLDGVAPKEAKCPNPVAKNIELAGNYQANGTPTLVHKNGQIAAGAMPRESLELWLDAKTDNKDKP